ncbi:SpoIIE family protein phosphatase [Actinomadura sp. LD22]|uniref:SpoIIE family protein phosphatase n=2 Tax=Actinomadura physcomitrii TaxID=2650748 RepID=A0A6I4MTS6_9ACTN|nr:SpoIIE family protein phosphatase [Actinomadura physcomitrii]
MDDVLVAAPDGAVRRAAGARLLRVEPVLVPVLDASAPDGSAGDGRTAGGAHGDAALVRGLGELLPTAGAAATEAIVSRLLALGRPAVSISFTLRLPVVPHVGDMPRALRIRPRAVAPHGSAVPPVLVSGSGESRVLPVPAGLPIGVGGEPFETMEIEVEDGSRLVLCTDGLLERRDRDIDQGLEELRVLLAGPDRPLEATCDALLDVLATTAPADDIAIVAVGLDGIPKDDVALWELEPEPSMVPRIRAQVAFKLAEWRLDAVGDTVQLLVSELVTNALLHGAGSIVLRLIRGDALLCEVYDDGQDMPHLRHADATAESGRGLQLVSHVAARWGTHRTDGGKVVWFEHRLPE